VRAALAAGVPAAQVYPQSVHASRAHPDEVRIAFDGDAVLFSDEAERVYQRRGWTPSSSTSATRPRSAAAAGPFKPLLEALHRLQQAGTPTMRIRTALVTARSAPAHERAIRTLMDWNIEVDEAMFLGGLPKGEFLREFEPDFFFDDQTGHIESAAATCPAGHVASGVSNPGLSCLRCRYDADPAFCIVPHHEPATIAAMFPSPHPVSPCGSHRTARKWASVCLRPTSKSEERWKARGLLAPSSR
jgi:hypothetical protein